MGPAYHGRMSIHALQLWLSLAVPSAAADWLVGPGEAAALVTAGATVLDTRGRLEYFSGHIPGAVRVDWRIGTTGGLLSGKLGNPSAAAAEFEALGVDVDRPVLVVGGWDAGWGEEGRIAWDLAYLGHPAISVLEGGMAAWGGATTVSLPAPVRGRFPAKPREALRATAASIQSGRSTVIDVREPAEFEGATPYGEARGGHIPGAASLPWRSLLGGTTPVASTEAPLVVYCTGGVRSAMAWLWLTDRGYTVANYDGSWWEWSREVVSVPG